MKRICLAYIVILALVAPAQGDIFWNVTFGDVVNNTNVGFDDPTLGATRQSTFMSVFTYLNTVFDHNFSVDFNVNNSQTDGAGFLASAGPYFSGATGFQNGAAFTHATTGIDPFGSVPDMESTFDFGYNWNSGTGTPSGSQFDLFSVALHEVSHGLGFLSLLSPSGLSEITGTDPGTFSVYDSFLERGNGTKLFAAGAGDYTGTAADLTSNDIFFGGANAKAANGGSSVKVYAPGAFASGSSISHIQGITGAVMQFSIGPGVERRAYTSQEIGILKDIGWSISSVPEPGSLALMLLVIVGAAGYRSRQRPGAGR